MASIPRTDFDCRQQQWNGYYADVSTRCQVFHICYANRTYSNLCPNGTVFSQLEFVCVWWNSFNCESAPGLYIRNAEVFSDWNNPDLLNGNTGNAGIGGVGGIAGNINEKNQAGGYNFGNNPVYETPGLPYKPSSSSSPIYTPRAPLKTPSSPSAIYQSSQPRIPSQTKYVPPTSVTGYQGRQSVPPSPSVPPTEYVPYQGTSSPSAVPIQPNSPTIGYVAPTPGYVQPEISYPNDGYPSRQYLPAQKK